MVSALVALSLACNLQAILAPTPTPTATVTPTATLTPSPSPTPTPAPAALVESAAQARLQGDWIRALSEYQHAYNLATTQTDQAQAQLGVTLTLVQSKRWEEGLQQAHVFLEGYPDHPDWGKGHFLRALCLDALGRFEQAEQAYGSYQAARPGRLDAIVFERRADLLRAAGRPADAVPLYLQALVGQGSEGSLRISLKIGRAYMEVGDQNAAVDQFLDVYQRAGDGFTRATADYLLGQAYTALGLFDEAFARYQDAVQNFPEAYDSYLGLVILVENGIPVDEFQRGLVDYYAEQYGVALAAFDRFLAVNPEHDGTVHYYRGLTLRALGNSDRAIEAWNRLIDSFPDHDLWDEAWEQKAYTQWAYLEDEAAAFETLLAFVEAAPEHARAAEFLFDAARSAEREGRLDAAAQNFEQVGEAYPDSVWAFRGLFLSGIAHYRLANLEEARRVFSKAMEKAQDRGGRAALYLWIGKTYQAQGDSESARAAWNSAREVDPNGYYGLRADDLARGRDPFDPVGEYDFSVDFETERVQAEAWLRETFSIESAGPLTELTAALQQDERMVRAAELWSMGQYAEAKADFESLRQSYVHDAEASYRLMHYFLKESLYQPAIYNAKNILDLAGLDDAEAMHAPIYFNHLRFGRYFGELILQEAEAHHFNALFLLSVVRQESLFEGFATSYASARGLMQIIPSTGRAVADQLGYPPNFEEDDLYRPLVSIRLGTQYLSDQRDRFDGDLYAALAAYNAGPGNALRWKELAPDDPDLFLEVVRFSQPRDYIRVISWAFANYRRLYVSSSP